MAYPIIVVVAGIVSGSSTIVVAAELIIMPVNLSQRSKALLPILATLGGILILVNLEQPGKVELPIYSDRYITLTSELS